LRGYSRCTGPGCLLCAVGRRCDPHDLLPVYDPVARAVAVLPVSANMRPGALKPQLLPVLQRVKAREKVMLILRKTDRTTFSVDVFSLLQGADDGAAVTASFFESFAAGRIELAAVYPAHSRERLANVPEIAAIMRARGVTA